MTFYEPTAARATIDTGIGAIIEAGGRSLEALSADEVAGLLAQHGVLLFRGFTTQKSDFVAFSDRLTLDFSNYRGGGLRFASLDRQSIDGMPTVMTTTGHTQSFAIPLHGEMHYLKEPPQLLWFYGDVPPARDGETTICDGAALFAALHPDTQAYFRNHQITYARNLVDGDWQTTFMTSDIADVAAFCAQGDVTMQYDAETKVLSTGFTCSALRDIDGQTIFINNVLVIWLTEQAFRSGWAKKNLPGLRSDNSPIVVRAGDGGELPVAVMVDVRAVSEALTRKIRWQQGDIALIDNHRMLHGRSQTDGGVRSILVRIGEPAFGMTVTA